MILKNTQLNLILFNQYQKLLN